MLIARYPSGDVAQRGDSLISSKALGPMAQYDGIDFLSVATDGEHVLVRGVEVMSIKPAIVGLTIEEVPA